jgi:exonuclease SbcD
MKVLHTADWHLGKTGSFFSFWEQQRVMNEICDIADSQNTDVVLVAGDSRHLQSSSRSGWFTL